MSAATKVWTLEELDSLPDDGNVYELIHGELFVTPPPNDPHETIAARLTRLLDPYVQANGLGLIYHPRAVVRTRDSQVEPDLMIRLPNATAGKRWENAPRPSLVVEILSPTTARRDHTFKRDFYLEVGIGEYWIVDLETRTIRSIRRGVSDVIMTDQLFWHPAGVTVPLIATLADVFAE